MTIRSSIPFLYLIFITLLLSACLGEPALPTLEVDPPATLAAPLTDPTVAAAPRIDLAFAEQPPVFNQSIPQISHDLIGRSDCLMCHKQGVSGAPRIPDAHRGLESNTCQACHTAPVSAELSGEEMYARVCARCHGENGNGGVGRALNEKTYLRSVSDEDIRTAIVRGRGAPEMLSWGDLGLLAESQIDGLVAMIRAWEATAPETADQETSEPANADFGNPIQGETLFSQFCTGCHGLIGETSVGDDLVLRDSSATLDDSAIARVIRDGAEGMPSFHALLTIDDINNLLALIRTWQAGPLPIPTPVTLNGEEVFIRVCTRCHGRNGEGGIAPPLNSKEFLTANADEDIRQWIMRGTLGTSMLSWGDLGLITTDTIEELVAFIRAWEPTAPSTARGSMADQPPSAESGDVVHGQQLFAQFCSGCHGLEGEVQTRGVILNSEVYLSGVNDEIIASQIQNGGRQMPSFHAVLIRQDLNDLLAFMRSGFEIIAAAPAPSFSADVFPILTEKCQLCHGTAGGWSAVTYDDVMNSGENAPVIIPGDPEDSLLIQKLRGIQTIGGPMPPSELLPMQEIELIIDWVMAGAPENGAQAPAQEGQETPESTPSEIPLIPHTLENRENCLMCHADGVGGAPAIPENHGDYTSEDCQSCHR